MSSGIIPSSEVVGLAGWLPFSVCWRSRPTCSSPHHRCRHVGPLLASPGYHGVPRGPPGPPRGTPGAPRGAPGCTRGASGYPGGATGGTPGCPGAPRVVVVHVFRRSWTSEGPCGSFPYRHRVLAVCGVGSRCNRAQSRVVAVLNILLFFIQLQGLPFS